VYRDNLSYTLIQDRYQTSNPQRIAEIALDVGKDIAKDYLPTDGLNVTLSQVRDSFGLMRNYITTSLSKTIQKAIRNRQVYVNIVQTDPSIRANQIRAKNTLSSSNLTLKRMYEENSRLDEDVITTCAESY
jgi:hypothetical protein